MATILFKRNYRGKVRMLTAENQQAFEKKMFNKNFNGLFHYKYPKSHLYSDLEVKVVGKYATACSILNPGYKPFCLRRFVIHILFMTRVYDYNSNYLWKYCSKKIFSKA